MSLKDHADYLIEMTPDLAPQIRAGLILATLGRVIPIGDYSEVMTNTWQVLGETYEANAETSKPLCKTYIVRDLQTTPRRWACNCEQGQSYGPIVGDFLSRPGRICKHIAAVCVAWLGGYPLRPPTVWDMVTRLIEEQAIYLLAGESLDLPHPAHIKLEYYDRNGKSGLVLKTGRARSEVLARWLPVADQPSGGEWQIVGEGLERYQEFVSKINGGAK